MDYSTLELVVLRERRRALDAEEHELSYLRRMIHGRIDILKQELTNRNDAGGEVISLVDNLPEILADEPTSKKSSTRHVSISVSDSETIDSRFASYEIGDATKSDPSILTDKELAGAIALLQAHEKSISSQRHVVHLELDALTSELTQRYRTGDAQVDDLLASAKVRSS